MRIAVTLSALALAAAASPASAAGQGSSLWSHNGSTMILDESTGRIAYDEPKPSISGTVRQGTVLFEGRFAGRRISGTAYVFKKGCEPAPYRVSGSMEDNPRGFGSRIVLTGAAPRRDPASCAIIGTTGAHSRLVFEEMGDI